MPEMRYVVTATAPNFPADALLEMCHVDHGLDRGVRPEVVSSARTSGTNGALWLVFAVAADHAQNLVDALTYEEFEEPVAASEVTLDVHNVSVHTDLADADAELDDVSLGNFLRSGR